MTNVDQFESVFRAAARTVFEPETVTIDSVLGVCDGDGSDAEEFAARSHAFLDVLDASESLQCLTVQGSEFSTVPELLERVEGGASVVLVPA